MHRALVLRENWLLLSTHSVSYLLETHDNAWSWAGITPTLQMKGPKLSKMSREMASKKQSCSGLRSVQLQSLWLFLYARLALHTTRLWSPNFLKQWHYKEQSLLSTCLPYRLQRARQAFPHWTQSLHLAQCLVRCLSIDYTNPYLHPFFPYSTKVWKNIRHNKMGVNLIHSQPVKGLQV